MEQDQQLVVPWLQTTLERVYPKSPPKHDTTLELESLRRARLSFQACVRNRTTRPITVTCATSGPDAIGIRIRRVGWVPQLFNTHSTEPAELEGEPYTPGFVPDPLFPESTATVLQHTNQAFWITLYVPEDLAPGQYELKVTLTWQGRGIQGEEHLIAHLRVHELVVEPRRDFPVTHWWNADCIYDWYKLPPFGDEFFAVLRPYLENMLDHGSNVIYVPLLNIRREIMKRPPQLLRVSETTPGRYEFGWDRVRRLVRMAKEIGFEYFEWSHIWAYSHDKTKAASVATPTPIYTEVDGKLRLLFPPDLDGTGAEFRNYLQQFIPEFKAFLQEEDILENSLFHLSDEPGRRPEDMENYRKARELLREVAPWMQVMDAIFSYEYLEQGLTDVAVAGPIAAKAFLDKGLPHWVYYCCGHVGPAINRFFDTPLPKIRAQGLIFYRLRALGFLHWGYNYWYEYNSGFLPESQVLLDPFADGSGKQRIPYGDPFVVYPGKDGPIDSIRWEVFAEALQDYAILQTLGVDPDDELLSSIVDYTRFPKSASWVQATMERILERAK